jgi:excinuclease ABC subunit B
MREAAADLEFEEAARLRDEIKRLEAQDMALGGFELGESGDAPTLEQRRAARTAAAFARPDKGKARQRAGKSGKPRRRRGA